MKQLTLSWTLFLALGCAAEEESLRTHSLDNSETTMNTETEGLYQLNTETLEGESIDLADFAGRVSLVVNVASACGYTPQYAGLQELHSEFESRGFSVLAFPSNEFGGQEPGSPAEIREFCNSRYSVEFPMMAKCEVKPGDGQSPVYSLSLIHI